MLNARNHFRIALHTNRRDARLIVISVAIFEAIQHHWLNLNASKTYPVSGASQIWCDRSRLGAHGYL